MAAGTAATLSVTATNATSVKITGSDGSSYTLAGSGGTQSVTPKTTTTYTATATGAGGTATATATVTVTASAAPTITMTATPTSVAAGTSATLTVTATNATSVTIGGSDGSSYTLLSSGGDQTVTPKTTTTYTATATGPGGTATATATVTVTAVVTPTVTITASPTSITSGNSSTLTVTATNATAVTLTGTDGSSYTIAPTGGTQTVSPTSTTTYVATATASGGSVSANVTVTVTAAPPTVTITASPTSIDSGGSSTLTVAATNATAVTVSGSDDSSYTLQPTGGTQTVSPTATTTYTATATGAGGATATATATVTLVAAGSLDSIDHVIFMMQENHSFDNYFGMLDPYRDANGWNTYDGTVYEVDGLTVPTEGSTTLRNFSNTDDVNGADITYPIFKFTTTCIDDESSAWEESYGDVNTYDFSTSRPILMNGFVHNAAGYDQSCAASGSCSGNFTDPTGERAMGYYDQGFLNYYYYMASQFALSDRWFSPVSSFTVDNRIATMTGGTTQGLTNSPATDKLPQLGIETIFEELDKAGVSWKIYYTSTEGNCLADDECTGGGTANFPATEFDTFTYSVKYLYMKNSPNEQCTAPTQPSSVVGDTTNSFCIDPTHIAPISDPTYGYFADLKNNTLPAFAWISPGFANNDEHPGSGQSILAGQAQVAKVINAFMASSEWANSVFFLSYDEGGGPYDHVPPVPGSTNINTDFPVGDATASDYPDISSIAINPDSYSPCAAPNGVPTVHCDLQPGEPGMASTDAAANPNDAVSGRGFAAQLGFRVPNMVISPFTKPHYVGHTPMDHTAVIKFVENRFIGPNANLTARDAAQPNLLDFFDFTNPPWATPPTPPTPYSSNSSCHADNMGP